MAKIALAAVGAVAGSFFGPEGTMIGLSIGLTLGEILFPPKIPGRMPLQDLQVSSSADGTPICFGYGTGRFAGQVIWSPGIKFYTVGSASTKGGGTPTGKEYYYTASFAAAFGEGPGVVEQIWADSKLIYQGGQNFGAFAPWNADTAYLPEQLVSYQWQPTPGEDYVTAIFRCVIANQGISPAGNSLYWTASGYPYWDSTIEYTPGNQVAYPRENGQIYAPTSGQIYTCVNPNVGQTPRPASDWQTMTEYYPSPTIYPGNEAQMPDPTIQANNGVDATPAFRGLIYCVWENMPLATFGNRVPNIRAQVNFTKITGWQTGPPVFVQRAAYRGTASTATVTLASTPTPGNRLLFLLGGNGGGFWGQTVTPQFSLDPGSPNGNIGSPVNVGAGACWRTVQTGDGLAWSFSVTNTSAPVDIFVIEIAGVETIATVKIASSGGSGLVSLGTVSPGTSGAVLGILAYSYPGNFVGGISPSGYPVLETESDDSNDCAVLFGATGNDLPSDEITVNLASVNPGNECWACATVVITGSTRIAPTGASSPTLDAVILDLCERSGLEATDVDVTALQALVGSPAVSAVFPTNIVQGYICERMATAGGHAQGIGVGVFLWRLRVRWQNQIHSTHRLSGIHDCRKRSWIESR